MKSFNIHYISNPKFVKVIEWTRLLTITGSTQLLIQAITLTSGILVIHLLSIHEYALYTLANTFLGAMALLSNSGISTGVMGIGGKVWQDKEKLGTVLRTGLDLRKRFAICATLIIMPVLIYLLVHNGASPLTTILICVSLIPAIFADLSDSLLEIIPRLHQNIKPLQQNQLKVGFGRLLLNLISLFAFPWSFIAILANSIPRIYGNITLNKIAKGFINEQKISSIEVRNEILKVVKRTLPIAIYIALSGQIYIWILSFFGSTEGIAQAGALGRLSIFINIISIVYSTLITPRFARLPNNSNLLLKRYIQIQTVVIGLSLCFIAITYMFPSQILWILGRKYLNLNTEVLLIISAGCLNFIIGTAFTLYSSRGWVINPLLSLFVSIASLIGGLFITNVSSLKGVLILNILVAGTEALMHLSYGFWKLIKLENR